MGFNNNVASDWHYNLPMIASTSNSQKSEKQTYSEPLKFLKDYEVQMQKHGFDLVPTDN